MLHGRKALRDRLSLASPPQMTNYATEGVNLIKAHFFGCFRKFVHMNHKQRQNIYILTHSPILYQSLALSMRKLSSRSFSARGFPRQFPWGHSTGGRRGSSRKGNFLFKRLFEFFNDTVKR